MVLFGFIEKSDVGLRFQNVLVWFVRYNTIRATVGSDNLLCSVSFKLVWFGWIGILRESLLDSLDRSTDGETEVSFRYKVNFSLKISESPVSCPESRS